MIPEAAYAMLACARIGAVHSIVFGGFSPDALASRVDDCGASLIITADEGPRGGRNTPLKANVDKAQDILGKDVKVLMVERTGADMAMKDGRDFSYNALMAEASPDCPAEPMNAEDPLFILYTSGSTGKPKGVLHTQAGYLVWASMTHELVFDYHDGDIYWCTADVGWVTGHSYIVYGPLANGAITLMFEGVPTYPDASRFWQVCRKAQGQPFSTPRPRRSARSWASGEEFVTGSDLSSLAVLGTVGEPINPEAWEWYWRVVGEGQCPHRRHLVADGNRRSHDHLAAGCRPDEAGLGNAALLRRPAGRSGTGQRRRDRRQRRRGRAGHQGQLARPDAHGLWRPRPVRRRPISSDYKGYYFTGDGCRRDAGRLLLDHRPRR